ncbi:MAG: ribosomal-protein-alanine N-acetyltransferase [Phycisphaerales bacterium]|jgi:ribosomal-protein-alanine N-acetyltransferase
MIQTERLILRPPTLDHIEPLMAVFGDAEAVKYLGDGCPRTTEQVTASFAKRARCLNDHNVTLWTVSLKDPAPGQHPIIGDCGLLPVNWEGPEFELAYRYRRDSWGNGYATEAARAAMEHAWGATTLDRVIGVTYPENTASIRVLTNAGFTHQGLTDAYYGKALELFVCPRG